MGQQAYTVKAPVSDGDFLSQDIAQAFERTYISITFFSDEYITPVSPTGGTATFTVTDDGFNYGSVQNGVVDVTKQDYARPYCETRVQKVKVNLQSVQGATHFRAVINCYS